MRNELVVVSGVVLALALAVGTAGAQQCGFPQPKKAKEIRLPLVPAFVSCGGACNLCGDEGTGQSPNTFTGINVPGCDPPTTFHEVAGSPPGGWLWGPKGEGSVRFTSAKSKILDVVSPFNTADVRIQVKLRDVHEAIGLANGFGSLVPVSRGTTVTRTNGPMTVVDVGVPFSVPVIDGRANVKTSANVALSANFGTTLPGCTVLELLQLQITDPNGNAFARPGVFLPKIEAVPSPTPSPTSTAPTPTSTAPTPTATPHTRCCEKPVSDTFVGCVDLDSTADPAPSVVCPGVYRGELGNQGSLCDSSTGTCEEPPSGGISNCCQFLNAGQSRCIDGPAWGTSTTNCVDQFNGTSFDNQRCDLDTGLCGP